MTTRRTEDQDHGPVMEAIFGHLRRGEALTIEQHAVLTAYRESKTPGRG